MNLLLVLLLSIASVIGAGAILIYVLRKLFNKYKLVVKGETMLQKIKNFFIKIKTHLVLR